MVNTPVLFETFVRVDYARQVWDAIKAAQPKKLYFYSNKGRTEKEGEIERNNEIRSWVKEIDWDCELHTFFREECVDVYTSLKGALDWVFSSEPEAIVLEDDCVPTPAFFSFCDQMIEKYRNEKKVWCISGDNYIDYKPKDADYFFSQYHFMYGWASWSDRWNKIIWDNIDIDSYKKNQVLDGLYETSRQEKRRYKEFDYIKQKVEATKCWDFALGFAIDINRGVTVHPKEHLVNGIGKIGSHSQSVVKTMFDIEAHPDYTVYSISATPVTIEPDKKYDYLFYKKYRRYKSLTNRAWMRLMRIIKGN